MTTPLGRRPTEKECWDAFWRQIAVISANLPYSEEELAEIERRRGAEREDATPREGSAT